MYIMELKHQPASEHPATAAVAMMCLRSNRWSLVNWNVFREAERYEFEYGRNVTKNWVSHGGEGFRARFLRSNGPRGKPVILLND
jgi:hypothetical protein